MLPPCDDRLMWETMLSVYRFPTMTAADELGLFVLLERAPATTAEVAERLKLSPRAAEALVGVLASTGFLERHGGRYRNTETTRQFLLPESPFYWGGMLRFIRDLPFPHSAILNALTKDRPKIYEGRDMWEQHETNPELAAAFTRAMHTRSVHLARAVAARCDWTGVRRVLDVAGGSGVFSIELAAAHPSLRCTVADLAAVTALACTYIGAADRVEVRTLDMFHEPLPPGYDIHFYSNIFHDWDETRCGFLAKRSFEALAPGGRIRIHEVLLNDTRDGPPAAAADSMHMMYFTEGKQRSAAEFEAILAPAGFGPVAVVPTHGYYSVVEARKP